MAGFRPFDVLSVPLEGAHLIEASAGTGKTFSITNLVLRLVAEEGLDIGRVLAVTFTETATRELRDRIRTVFNQALFLVEGPDAADDSVAAAVVRQAVARNDRRTVEKRLQKALLCFDEAGIFTIHGFCNRVLKQFAFESALPFDTELITDQSRYTREVADDFWRRTFGRASRLLCAAAAKQRLSPDDLIAFSRILNDKPTIRLVPEAPPDPAPELALAFEAARDIWAQEGPGIMALLRHDPRLSRGREAYKIETLEAYGAELDRLFAGDVDDAGLAFLERFTPAALEKGLKPKKRVQGAPEHPFFDACRDYVRAEGDFGLYYRHVFRQYLERELARRKEEGRVRYYSDLLTGLRQALAEDRRGLLAAAIREKYLAVLIDEFQDTDPVQYDIFQWLFGGGRQRLFLIGDPKQSIYGFRSADVFSYIRAAAAIPSERKYALPKNWRSETTLVQAVNHLFGRADNPFVLGEAIGFQPVLAAPDNVGNRAPLRIDDRPAGQIDLWFIRRDEADDKLNREEAGEVVMAAVVSEIAALLNHSADGKIRRGEKPLGPADIAVLITRNADAGSLKDRLSAAGIPAVISRTGNVFATPEAGAMERVLRAMAAPSDPRRLNAVLVDDLVACSADELREFLEDDARRADYEGHLQRFGEYHQQWRTTGFMTAFRRFLSDYRVRRRLLGLADGERRLTNVLQLAELIHQAAVLNRLGVNGLLEWIAARRAADEEAPEEEELRLERDDEAVQILTVWKSKGLQFPVVFCPFLWAKGAAVGGNDVIFHEGHDLVLDLAGSDEGHRRAASREKLAELVRLLYVALTRAINRCYLIYGRIGEPGRSGATSLDYILSGGLADTAAGLEPLTDRIRSATAESLFGLVAERLGEAAEVVHCHVHRPQPLRPVPATAAPAAALGIKAPAGAGIDQEWGLASFTHLAFRGRAAGRWRDEGEIRQDESFEPAPETARPPAASIFDFPAGPRPGLCVHWIFEHLDFSRADAVETRRIIDQALRQFGLASAGPTGPSWNDLLYQMVGRVLRTPILPADPGFSLDRLTRERTISEMGFYYPIGRLTPARIRSALRRFAGDDERRLAFADSGERLEFRPLHGYMRGFIDLVFEHDGRYYLLDWKTNHLGYDLRDYDAPRLNRCVAEESYFLQYYIYTVALHRYLAGRLPDYDYDVHFGGAVYLFVRGVHPDAPGNGVYFDRPDRALIDGLDRALG